MGVRYGQRASLPIRVPRPQIRDRCVHVTRRCQQRECSLKFGIDRRQYQRRLLQASREFRRLRLLDYTTTSNRVHLLLWVPRMAHPSGMMHWLQGTYTRDHDRRKNREGAFWRGRCHRTRVQSGLHLSRCLFYLDIHPAGKAPEGEDGSRVLLWPQNSVGSSRGRQ